MLTVYIECALIVCLAMCVCVQNIVCVVVVCVYLCMSVT